jgi:hypothetical protein
VTVATPRRKYDSGMRHHPAGTRHAGLLAFLMAVVAACAHPAGRPETAAAPPAAETDARDRAMQRLMERAGALAIGGDCAMFDGGGSSSSRVRSSNQKITFDVVDQGGAPIDGAGLEGFSMCSCPSSEHRADEGCQLMTVLLGGVMAIKTVYLPSRTDDSIEIRIEADWVHRRPPPPDGCPKERIYLTQRFPLVNARWSVKAAPAGGGPWDAMRDGSYRLPPHACRGRVEADVARAEIIGWCARIAKRLGLPPSAMTPTPGGDDGGERPMCTLRAIAEIGGVRGAVHVDAVADDVGDRGTLVVEGSHDPRWCGAVRTAMVSEGALLPRVPEADMPVDRVERGGEVD